MPVPHSRFDPALRPFWLALILAIPTAGWAQLAPTLRFEAEVLDPHVGNVCYALTTADVNGDKRLDVVAVTEDAVVWFENPGWTRHEIIRGKTERDNVCIAARDIDGDGRIDFALGAGWRPPDTANASTLQWLGRDSTGAWQLHPIGFTEPTLHRMRWGEIPGKRESGLVVIPLQGRGTKGPDWGAGSGVKILLYRVPADPTSADWPVEVIDDSLHTIHNFQILPTGVLVAAWEGVFLFSPDDQGGWKRQQLGTGYQEPELPNKGSSEIKLGRLPWGTPAIATIEPWHGRQVVVYEPEAPATEPDPATAVARSTSLWNRTVVDDGVTWGHAIWFADLDGVPGDELIVGQRDPRTDDNPLKGPGVWIYQYSKTTDGSRPAPTKVVVDDAGMACEDALAADLDGDGRLDIVAGGRATHNVKVYWNKTGDAVEPR